MNHKIKKIMQDALDGDSEDQHYTDPGNTAWDIT
jgi:hypothetical protein